MVPVGKGDIHRYAEVVRDRAAVGRSMNTVRADVPNVMNNSPDFNASEVARSIDEDAAVGDPVGDVIDVDRNEDWRHADLRDRASGR